MQQKLLIADDEKDIRRLLREYFEMQGYVIMEAENGIEAVKKAEENPDLILLDINMPKMDGLEVCKKIRPFFSGPILFLTAKIEERDRISGLMLGGDDYIMKPFSMAELDARIRAHLRREQRKNEKEGFRFFGDFSIQYSARRLCYLEEEIPLTRTEFDIVEILSTNAGIVFGKEAIYEKLWGFDKEGDSTIITEHVRRIRKKLSEHSDKELIETVWGVGYRWIT